MSQVTAVNKDATDGKKSSEPEIDMASVLALGYGPISSSRLAELEKQGLIESYVSGGKRKFRKTSYTNKQASLFAGGRGIGASSVTVANKN